MKTFLKITVLFCLCAAFPSCHGGGRSDSVLIPEPAVWEQLSGGFPLTGKIIVEAAAPELAAAAGYLCESVAEDASITGKGLSVSAGECDSACGRIVLSVDEGLSDEAYVLSVSDDCIDIRGGSRNGVVYGISTLRQLLWTAGDNLSCVRIEDTPRFPWRGVMMDVSRHFFTVSEMESLIDWMALYKFNRLHLHLTDDQGWRLEMKDYPLLTSVGAWRLPGNHDETCRQRVETEGDTKFAVPADRMKNGLYGGFYTQEQMRSLIGYASDRGIEIIPEIDFPGHSLAVLSAYPDFSCDGKGGSWGKNFSSPLCLGNDEVLDFCKGVLTEVFRIFPSDIIHIGGDEVERTAWESCPECLARAEECGLGSVDSLQSWFTREIEAFCRANGKRIIGWDEVADDGLSSESMVMWWRNWSPESLETSVRQGHDVVVSSSEYYYLAEDQDDNTLAKVYDYEPVPSGLDGADKRITGIQGHLWSEVAPTVEAVGERLFPRLYAIAETAWTDAGNKDFAGFRQRLAVHLRMLDAYGWKYRFDNVGNIYDSNVMIDKKEVVLQVPEGAGLYYTLDGSMPGVNSALYEEPFELTDDCVMKMRCYNGAGVPGPVQTAVFRKTVWKPSLGDGKDFPAGFSVRWYEYDGKDCTDIEKAPLKGTFVCESVCIPDGVEAGNVGLVVEGYFEVPEDGIYTFYTYSDDGSVLEIDGGTVVDNDGMHSRLEKSGQAALRKGWHRLSLRYFDPDGGMLEAGMIDTGGKHLKF